MTCGFDSDFWHANPLFDHELLVLHGSLPAGGIIALFASTGELWCSWEHRNE